MDEAPSSDEVGDRLSSYRPREPVPHLVLMRQHRGTHPDDHELFERGVLRRLPRLAPHLIPAREHARVAASAPAVLDRETAGHDRAVALAAPTPPPKGRGREAELRPHDLP